jgi:hypothetical protein
MLMSDREEYDDDTDANSSAHNAQNTQHINKNNTAMTTTAAAGKTTTTTTPPPKLQTW